MLKCQLINYSLKKFDMVSNGWYNFKHQGACK